MRPSTQSLQSPFVHLNLCNVRPPPAPQPSAKAPLHPSAAPQLTPSISTYMEEKQIPSICSPMGPHSLNTSPHCPRGPGSG